MSSTWTVAGETDTCGYDGARIPEGEPMELITTQGRTRALKRCEQHRHSEIDWAQVDQARHAAETRAERNAIAETAPLAPLLPARMSAPKRVSAFASLSSVASSATLFDHKAAAAGDQE